MKTINALIADAEVMLALSPEELGLQLLRILPEYVKTDQNRQFHPNNIRGQLVGFVYRPPIDGSAPYPDKYAEEADRAVAEAFSWLREVSVPVALRGAYGSRDR